MRVKWITKITVALTGDEVKTMSDLLSRICVNGDIINITHTELKFAHDLRAALYENVPHID